MKIAAALLVCISLCASAQQPAQQQQAPPPSTQQQQQGSPATQVPKKEQKITPQEAQKLFSDLDGVLRFVSDDTKLPIKYPVKKQLVDRDQVQQYVEQKMADDKDTQRFERSQIVLEKFGFIPRDFNLRQFFVSMLREQIAGYYDSKTKTAYLLDWIEPEIQKPVMAHELTHALQDQNFDLERFSNDDQHEAAEKRGDYNRANELDEDSAAKEAFVEGQGMISMIDYTMRDYGKTTAELPQAVDMMASNMADDKESPVLAKAPMLLRESLIFPYRDGMEFVQQVLLSKGRSDAFAGLFQHPPTSTYEVMTPAAYLRRTVPPVTKLPDIPAALGSDWQQYDVGAMGEFDVYLLLKQFSDQKMVQELTKQWDGGAYYAAIRKGAQPNQTSSIGLVYVSQWRAPDAAQRFARIYADSLRDKYRSVAAAPCSPCEEGERRFNTDEGFVEIDQRGDRVIVTESIPAATATKLRDQSLAGQGELQVTASAGELGVNTVPSWIRALLSEPIAEELRVRRSFAQLRIPQR